MLTTTGIEYQGEWLVLNAPPETVLFI